MAKITAGMVKELRQRSGAGMMDCKKALVEHEGNVEEALVYLQKKGIARAAKKAGRTAAEGIVATRLNEDRSEGLIIEINCETDFVSRNEDFQNFVGEVADLAFSSGVTDIDGLKGLEKDGQPLEEWVKVAVAKIGENVQLRRLVRAGGAGHTVGDYIHAGSQIGVLVTVEGSGDGAYEFARNVAMHVAATNPQVLRPEDIDASERAKQKDIFLAQAADSGKPENIREKIVEGRLRKWQSEISLVKQPYVKEPDMTVEQYQKKSGGVTLAAFTRYQVGEGIQKEESNLAAEVAAITGQ